MHISGTAPTITGSSPAFPVRVRSLLLRPRLDRTLLGGARPSPASELGWRARQLTSPRRRQRLADRLERVVQDAASPQPARSSAVPLNREEIRRCAGLLYNLAAELRDDQPVTPRGVLVLRRLLYDGGSPLYAGEADGALELELRHARAALLLG
jgi:hypothetical protein